VNNRQTVFVAEYLKDFNATQAAIRAGYSAKTAYSIGQRLLKDVETDASIKAAISERIMGKDEVLTRLADIARGDVADLMALSTGGFSFVLESRDNETGELKANPKTKLIKKIRQKVTTYLAKNESGEDREVVETEIELYPADNALGLLAKYHGLLIDRTDITTQGEKINMVEVAVPPEPNDSTG
jgi:phage terminase small subunit